MRPFSSNGEGPHGDLFTPLVNVSDCRYLVTESRYDGVGKLDFIGKTLSVHDFMGKRNIVGKAAEVL